jgi:hypothetical protein
LCVREKKQITASCDARLSVRSLILHSRRGFALYGLALG